MVKLLDIKPGDKYKLKCGSIAIVINYHNKNNVDIVTNTGFEITTSIASLRSGSTKDKLMPSVFGVGYLGLQTKYDSYSKCYKVWIEMMKRCYHFDTQEIQPSYKQCTVEKEWHNFSNFCVWFDNNYIKDYHLDKDLRYYGNKIYSSDTCIFVPRKLNNLFYYKSKKDSGLPHGIKYENNGYSCSLSDREYITVYSIKEAANIYWNMKLESVLKLIIEYKEFKHILFNNFEEYFNEYYYTGEN